MHIRSIANVRIAALLVIATAAACGPDGPDAGGSSGAAGAGAGAGGSDGAEADIAPGDHVEFIATEFAFEPSVVTATAGSY